jgi:hypothetical protein
MTHNPKDIESRLSKLEENLACVFIGWIMIPVAFLVVWTLLWKFGYTDEKSPLIPDRIPFKEWKERNNPTQPPKE